MTNIMMTEPMLQLGIFAGNIMSAGAPRQADDQGGGGGNTAATDEPLFEFAADSALLGFCRKLGYVVLGILLVKIITSMTSTKGRQGRLEPKFVIGMLVAALFLFDLNIIPGILDGAWTGLREIAQAFGFID